MKNPYTRRSDRIIDAVDEWFHRRGFGWVKAGDEPATVVPWWGHLVKPLCDVREKRLMGKDEWESQQMSRAPATSVSNSVSFSMLWKVVSPHKGRRDV
jgi:hypothetical protein